MKKSIIVFTLFWAFIAIPKSYGQDSIKANYRDFLTELNVNLFQGELSLSNALKQVKFRYMYTQNSALRLGIIVDTKKLVDDAENVYGTNPYKNKDTRTSTLIGLNFGLEKHFPGTKRLSPYIGGELSLGYKWSKEEYETNGLKTTIKGAWQQYQTVQNSNGSYTYQTSTGERGFFSYGLNFVTGFDFYMAKHLFIGYELEFGLTNKKYSDIDISYSGSSSTSSSTNYDSREFSLGPRIINGIRIGYVF
jgi:hypothetical protein